MLGVGLTDGRTPPMKITTTAPANCVPPDRPPTTRSVVPSPSKSSTLAIPDPNFIADVTTPAPRPVVVLPSRLIPTTGSSVAVRRSRNSRNKDPRWCPSELS